MRRSSKYKVYFCVIVACLLALIATVHFNVGSNGVISMHSSSFGANFLSMSPGFSVSNKMVIFDSIDHIGSLQFLSKPPMDWSVLVINVHTVKQKKTCPDCIYVFSSIAESLLGAESSSSLSKASKVKMATYLYLLSRPETEWIYITDRAIQIPYKALARVVDRQIETGPVFLGPGDVFEPCRHFVDPVTWYGPGISVKSQFNVKNISRRSVYAVVDECFHDGVTEQRWKMSVDQRAPILYVMPGTFAAFDFNNILLTKETMWTLIAAIRSLTTTMASLGQQSLKVNMAVQRILWETRHQIGFISAPPQRKVCSFCSVTSGIETLGKAQRQAMADWRCHDSNPLTLCLEELIKSHVGHDESITSALDTWLHLLKELPGKQIDRQPLSFEKLLDKSIGRRLFFAPARLLRNNSVHNSSLPYPLYPFHSVCKNSTQHYKALIPSDHRNKDVLLLIIINDPFFVRNIPMLEYLYGRYFNHIVYCSTNIGFFVAFYQTKNPNYPVSFITMHNIDNTHVCTTTAIKMNYDVTGYFQFSDDVLVNLWNYQNIPMRHPWFQSFKGVGRMTDQFFTPGNGRMSVFGIWRWTKSLISAAWEHLQRLRACPIHGPRVGLFLDTLAKNTGCPTCIYFGNADIFYLPQSIAKNFTYFADFFHKYDINFEITIITVLGGLVPKYDIYGLSGRYTFGKDEQKKYEEYYKKGYHFYHPWKFSNFESDAGAKFFCERCLHNFDMDLRIRP